VFFPFTKRLNRCPFYLHFVVLHLAQVHKLNEHSFPGWLDVLCSICWKVLLDWLFIPGIHLISTYSHPANVCLVLPCMLITQTLFSKCWHMCAAIQTLMIEGKTLMRRLLLIYNVMDRDPSAVLLSTVRPLTREPNTQCHGSTLLYSTALCSWVADT
jgi:hypothetical protein